MVDEFSSFARMPKPVFRSESLTDIVGHAVFLFEVAHTGIKFNFEHDGSAPQLICDRRQLGQAMTNILKNAAESIEERVKTSDVSGEIDVKMTVDGDTLQVSFRDNGLGLPADRDRILEPYVTTRSTGSGLGLAIVKKIVEEHFADISFNDADGGGALVTLTFSPEIVASKVGALIAHTLTTSDKEDQS